MSFLLSRKKSSRFSWIDNGLLILGILGISHQTVAKLLFGDPAPQTQSAPALVHNQPSFPVQSYQPGTQPFSVPSPQSLLASQWNDLSNRYGNYLPSAGYQPQNPYPTPVGNAQRPNTYTPSTGDTTNPSNGYWPASNSGVPQNQNPYGMPNGNNAQPQYSGQQYSGQQYSGQQYSGQMPSQFPANGYPNGSSYNPNAAPAAYGIPQATVPFGTSYPPNASNQPGYGPSGSLNNSNSSYSSHYGAPIANTPAYTASSVPWPAANGSGVSSNAFVPATTGSAGAPLAAREGWPSNYVSGASSGGYPFPHFVPAGNSYQSQAGNSYVSPALTTGGAWQTTFPSYPQQPSSYPVR
ncbi:MAG: hypothetical protein KGQ60_08120 [Planctomycetes bacterium]|nr:hypothetical protein [Planctomycetota bacterium]